jgi:hypothetical protein
MLATNLPDAPDGRYYPNDLPEKHRTRHRLESEYEEEENRGEHLPRSVFSDFLWSSPSPSFRSPEELAEGPCRIEAHGQQRVVVWEVDCVRHHHPDCAGPGLVLIPSCENASYRLLYDVYAAEICEPVTGCLELHVTPRGIPSTMESALMLASRQPNDYGGERPEGDWIAGNHD